VNYNVYYSASDAGAGSTKQAVSLNTIDWLGEQAFGQVATYRILIMGNTFVGAQAGASLLTWWNPNTFIGEKAGQSVSSGVGNTIRGFTQNRIFVGNLQLVIANTNGGSQLTLRLDINADVSCSPGLQNCHCHRVITGNSQCEQ
jgi:hypothetical protein